MHVKFKNIMKEPMKNLKDDALYDIEEFHLKGLDGQATDTISVVEPKKKNREVSDPGLDYMAEGC